MKLPILAANGADLGIGPIGSRNASGGIFFSQAGKPSVEAMSTVMPGRTEYVHQRSFVQHKLLLSDDAGGCVQERPASQVPRVAKSGHLIVGSQEEPDALLVGQRSDHRLELMPRRIRETPRMHVGGHGRDGTIGHFAAGSQ